MLKSLEMKFEKKNRIGFKIDENSLHLRICMIHDGF